ncbi:MAG: hypothetical protein H6Q90_1139 [Deltaproteobacteria bacterium]|nr:hypothetical protein [Deltaproteobacteria bacterium]
MLKPVGRARGIVSAVVAITAITAIAVSPAAADDSSLYDRLWPHVPDAQRLTLSEQITDQLTALGNQLGYHLDVLSQDMVALRVDGRRRRAYLSVGAGEGTYLSFRLASDVHFTQGLARVATTVDLGIAGRTMHLELPEVEMVPASYRGERGVEVRLPLFRRRF